MRNVLGAVAWTLLAACAAPSPPRPSASISTATLPSPPRAVSAPATPPSAPASAAKRDEVVMFPVGEIYSLIDLWRTDDGKVEARLGYDDGGGTLGAFRFVALDAGRPDFTTETTELSFADTTGIGGKVLVGRRPELVYHAWSGFRSAATDSGYQRLDGVTWRDLAVPPADGVGTDLTRWTDGRLLERRDADPNPGAWDPTKALLPSFRVVRGGGEAPSLPSALRAQLNREVFVTSDVRVLASGHVVVLGREASDRLAAIVWSPEAPRAPRRVVGPTVGVDDDAHILGGDDLAAWRAQAGRGVFKLVGDEIALESTMADGQLPDVWFGRPQVIDARAGAFARLQAGGPWLPIPLEDPDATRSFVVDAAGTIWMSEGEQLRASRKPTRAPYLVKEVDLVARRKASILGGGSWDATGERAQAYGPRACRARFVVLDEAPASAPATDYPAHRAALKGHTELAGARFVVSQERDRRFFGALVGDDEVARKLAVLVGRRVRSSPGTVICAEPAITRELHVDLATGALRD